jgi:hypothetical protein
MNEFDCDRIPTALFEDTVEDFHVDEDLRNFVADAFDRESFALFEDREF